MKILKDGKFATLEQKKDNKYVTSWFISCYDSGLLETKSYKDALNKFNCIERLNK